MATMMMDPPRGRVDKTRGVIRGVKLVSGYSRRGRRYPQHVLKAAIPLYESSACYVNHADPGTRRKAEDKIGTIRNVRESMDGSGLMADLHYNPKHPMAERLEWAAENDPEQFGLSHNAVGPTRREPDGSETVLRIDKIQSVDLVGSPATVTSLFEGEWLEESLDGYLDHWHRRTITAESREAWLRGHRTALQEDTAPPAKVEPAAPPATTKSLRHRHR